MTVLIANGSEHADKNIRMLQALWCPAAGQAPHLLVCEAQCRFQLLHVSDGIVVKAALPKQVPEILAEDLCAGEARLHL